MEPLLVQKVSSHGFGHMTKMEAMPIYGKSFTNVLRNFRANALEILYVALEARALQIFSYDNTELT